MLGKLSSLQKWLTNTTIYVSRNQSRDPPLNTTILPTENEDHNKEWVHLMIYHTDYLLGHAQPPTKYENEGYGYTYYLQKFQVYAFHLPYILRVSWKPYQQ